MNQDEHQTLGSSEVSGVLDQTQYGPYRFDPNQGNNPGNSMNVTQNSTQHADPGAFQSNLAEASCGTSGLCTVTQKVSNDKQHGTNSCGPASSCDISVQATAGTGEGDGVSTCNDSECTNPPFSPLPNPVDPFNEANNICEFLSLAPPCNYYPD